MLRNNIIWIDCSGSADSPFSVELEMNGQGEYRFTVYSEAIPNKSKSIRYSGFEFDCHKGMCENIVDALIYDARLSMTNADYAEIARRTLILLKTTGHYTAECLDSGYNGAKGAVGDKGKR